jgi:acyl-CoA thioesterase-1
LVILCCCALWATACSEPPPALPHLAADAVIVAFGDSLTYGTGAPPAASYPATLERMSGHRVINAGVPGELSTQGRDRLVRVLDDYHPGLLILLHGGNDLLRGNERVAAVNLRAMVQTARQRGIPVVLIAVPRPGLGLSAPDYYGAIARDYHLPLLAHTVADILREPQLKSDIVHPNAEGYRRLAKAVFGLLKRSGAL